MDVAKAKVGDEVFYVVLERAEILKIDDGRTLAIIKLLTGPLKDQILAAPLGELKTVGK
jgi:hypothetical protein